jgi:hypothetical protein
LIELSGFFNSICSKQSGAEELYNMSISIRKTLYRLEMTFPPVFFDIMMHLPVHLVEEANLVVLCAIDGCIQLRDTYVR